MSAIPIRVRDAARTLPAALCCAAALLAWPAAAAEQPGRPVLQELACRASAIVVGSVASGESSVAPTGDAIYTEYAVAVEQTLKPRAVALPAEILVRRVGGEVGEGRLRSFRSRLLPPLEVGRRYLLFLTPASDSFAADIPGGTLAVGDSGRVSQVDAVGFVRELPRPGADADYRAVVAAIRGAVAQGCPR
jgi:hypothetical protein